MSTPDAQVFSWSQIPSCFWRLEPARAAQLYRHCPSIVESRARSSPIRSHCSPSNCTSAVRSWARPWAPRICSVGSSSSRSSCVDGWLPPMLLRRRCRRLRLAGDACVRAAWPHTGPPVIDMQACDGTYYSQGPSVYAMQLKLKPEFLALQPPHCANTPLHCSRCRTLDRRPPASRTPLP